MTLDAGQDKTVTVVLNSIGQSLLKRRKSIAVNEDHLRFKPHDAVVVADLSSDELNRMPARF